METEAPNIVAGSQLAADIIKQLFEEVRKLGGNATDLVKLSQPEGRRTIVRMAECIMPTALSAARRCRDWPIEELEMSVRTNNVLRKKGIETMEDLFSRSRQEIEAIEGIGTTSFVEIRDKLGFHDIVLGTKLD
jgi:DNA-directed RNA polymerase alpha subunit